jgi:hypothetical protein
VAVPRDGQEDSGRSQALDLLQTDNAGHPMPFSYILFPCVLFCVTLSYMPPDEYLLVLNPQYIFGFYPFTSTHYAISNLPADSYLEF